jgi:translation initiation factor IF-2
VITFIDTPGHAAFTEMRARGAKVTDIVVLVVAATEGIMPQTVEAIEHARAAEVPIVVAINKCDMPGANPAQTRQRLMEHGLVPEDFGGDTICVDVSATKGTNIPKLLEMIQLQAEVLELRADPDRRASGVVLEARLDKGRGPVATVLVQQGTLRPGDTIVAGTAMGRVRAMEDERGRRLESAGPSVPVQVTGLADVPDAGELMHAVESERVAKEIVSHREAQKRDGGAEVARPKLSLEEIFAAADGGGVKELAVVLKADTRGSVEAIRDALLKLSRDSVKVDVLLAGVGAVTESDVMLAKASGAVVVAFHVRPEPAARRAAEGQGVDVRVYQIIYEVVDEIKKAMEGLLPPTISEAFLGRAEVRQTFSVPRIGTIAGCFVTEGGIRRGGLCRLVRDGVQIYEGRIGSLKRFKDDVREVATGFECGIGIDGYNDVKVGDVIETYALKEERPSLE